MMAAYHIKCLRYQDSTQERLVTVFKDDCENRPGDLHIRIAKDIKSQHLPESSIYTVCHMNSVRLRMHASDGWRSATNGVCASTLSRLRVDGCPWSSHSLNAHHITMEQSSQHCTHCFHTKKRAISLTGATIINTVMLRAR